MQRTSEGHLLVITDANVLINFMNIGRFDLLGRLRTYAFRIPEEVYQEISYPAQRPQLDRALDEGWIEKVWITAPEEIGAYKTYRERMGNGEGDYS